MFKGSSGVRLIAIEALWFRVNPKPECHAALVFLTGMGRASELVAMANCPEYPFLGSSEDLAFQGEVICWLNLRHVLYLKNVQNR